jgi:hypothetical protein
MATQVKVPANRAQKLPAVVSKPFGLSYPELLAAGVVLLFSIFVLTYYFTTLGPAKAEVSELGKQLEALKKSEAEMTSNSQKPVETQVDMGKAALESLEGFKSSRLRALSVGRIALINDINALAKKHSVQLTSGIDMSLDSGEDKLELDDKGTNKKKSSGLLDIFPNLKTRFTVGGDYAKLRAFISELEANKQFLTIDALNLAAIRQGEGERSRRRNSASGIGLSIELTAFFYPQQ